MGTDNPGAGSERRSTTGLAVGRHVSAWHSTASPTWQAGPLSEKLSRRDVARWLVSHPGAAEVLPQLRRELMAKDRPLSAAFWDSAEALPARIGAGQATVGEVQTWLESTGSEPTKIVGLHVWEDERERQPRADDLYQQLVEHLEQQVARGTIDPDRLLASGPALGRAAKRRRAAPRGVDVDRPASRVARRLRRPAPARAAGRRHGAVAEAGRRGRRAGGRATVELPARGAVRLVHPDARRLVVCGR